MTLVAAAVGPEGIALAADSYCWGLDDAGKSVLDEPDQVKVLPMWDHFAVGLAGIEHVIDPLRYPVEWLQGKTQIQIPGDIQLKPHEERGESPFSYILNLAEDELDSSPPATFEDFCTFLRNLVTGCLEREREARPDRNELRVEHDNKLIAIAAGYTDGIGFVRELRFGVGADGQVTVDDPSTDYDGCVSASTSGPGTCWIRGLARVSREWLENNPDRWDARTLPGAIDSAVAAVRMGIEGYAETDYPPGGTIRCVTVDPAGSRIVHVTPEHGSLAN